MFQFLPDKFWFLEQKSPFPAFDFPSQIITDDGGPSWEGVPGRSTDAIASSWTIPPQCKMSETFTNSYKYNHN